MRVKIPTVVALASLCAFGGGAAALLLAQALGFNDDEPPVTALAPAPPPVADAGRVAPPLLGNGFEPAAIYARRAAGVVTLYTDLGSAGTSQGSGFVVDKKGTILTNAHVITNVAESPLDVTGARSVVVVFKDGDRVPGRIVGWDLFSDVGVVRVEPAMHAVAPVPLGDSSTVVVGAPVAAIGSPFQQQSSLSVGVVSATGRSIDSLTSGYAVADAIQIDAPINHGNSGGPLFDARGRVIGINAQIRSNSGNAEGVGFAIPINVARRTLDQLVTKGRVAYAYIGIKTQDVTPGLAKRFGFASRRGALIASVEPGTPAERAGLAGGGRTVRWNGLDVTVGGDLIVRIGNAVVQSSEDVSRIVTYQLAPGQRVPIELLREGTHRETVLVTLSERPSSPS